MIPRGKGVGAANWLLSKTSGFVDARLSRRSFISRATLLGSAVAATGCTAITRQGTSYTRVTDCPGGLCRDGYTEFCCVINRGMNRCPSGTVAAGWWRADGSPYCSTGVRYYIDCNESCCGPVRGDGFCAGCSPCRCADGCHTRKVHCNYFRYGQCNQGVRVGPIACRMVSCTPPYNLNIGCSPSGAVDHSTRSHNANCAAYVPPPPPPPLAAVLPMAGAVGGDAAEAAHVFARFSDGSVRQRRWDGAAWTEWASLGSNVTSGISAARLGDRLFVFARRTSANSIWHAEWDGSTWSSFTVVGARFVSDPTTVVMNGSLYLFAKGNDNALWFTRHNGSAFQPWVRLGAYLSSTPSPVALGKQLFVFARLQDRQLWYAHFNSSTWNWRPLAGLISADPAGVAYGDGLMVFVRGDNNMLYSRRHDGWSWESAGYQHVAAAGAFASDPVAVDHAGRVWVFTRTSAGELRYGSFDGSSWSSWQTLGTGIDTNPSTAVVDGVLYLLADTTSSTSRVWTHDGATWSSAEDLGGPTAPFRAR